tara:strand:+ start:499 stop:873 length:375 start_codon:yes stop_codon:yes gene_type:complete
MDNEIIEVLKLCNIVIDNENQLQGQLIPRDILLSDKTYELVKEKIPNLKKKLSSSSLTALHKNAKQEQKWPLLNFVRQVLKTYNYNMKPIRKADGYTKEGKKKYKRLFIIEKLKKITPDNPVLN